MTDLSNIDELTRWLDVLPRQARITIGAWAALRVLPMIGAGPPGAGKLSVDPDEISAGQPDDDENGERFESGARNYEQVHRGDLRRGSCEGNKPSVPARGGGLLNHVLRHA